ncbi:MAG TPA: UDP-2,3-diacylglucosamine diphosphatase LpxI [Xanthobacteraceae bacterium]|nr:UDP-2,3-diacylglucosamine diphosphatase LpxI [Xanthobacteraceae bacterium]
MISPTQPLSSPVGLVAGGGVLPFAVAEALAARGIASVIFAIKGFCDPGAVSRFKHHWISLGQLGRLTRLLRAENCRDLAFIGTLIRPALSEIRLDWGTMRVITSVWAAFRGGDDHLLSGIGRLLEKDGFRLVGIKDLAPELLMPAGCLTRARPDHEAEKDIRKGREVLGVLSPFDIGQAVVVINGHVVGVEGIEGTDALLARIAQLRAEGRIRVARGRGALVKAPKRGQDLRLDLPTTGLQTVEGVIAAGLAGLATVAGYTVVADPQPMIETADRAGVFVTGLPA